MEEGFTARFLSDRLKALGPVKVINLRINSPGGAVFEGLAIYNALRNHGAKIIAHIDGAALSAASLVAMAGDEIRIAANAFMMIHNPMLTASGDVAELRHKAELLERVTQSAVSTYATRTKQTDEAIVAMMAAETWMDAEEAKAKGFADTITADSKALAAFDPAQFRNVPEQFQPKDLPMSTVQEIRAACPGADEKFIVAQLEAGNTIAAAQTAWMAVQQQEIAALKSRQATSVGVNPLPAGARGREVADYGDAITAFGEAVAAEMASGRPQHEATMRVCRKDPELRKAYVAAHNELHRTR